MKKCANKKKREKFVASVWTKCVKNVMQIGLVMPALLMAFLFQIPWAVKIHRVVKCL